jgi:hypothetical protein
MKGIVAARAACMIACLAAPVASLALVPREGAPLPQVAANGSALVTDAGRARPDSLTAIIAGRDVFRAARQPSAVRFDARGDQPAAPPPQAPPRPPFALVGILGGEDPAALLDGVPGTDHSRVVRTGDRLGDYTVRAIGANQVVIAGPDTTMTLRLRNGAP